MLPALAVQPHKGPGAGRIRAGSDAQGAADRHENRCAPSGEALEPTAQSSDHAPELAGGSDSDDAGSHFGEALSKVAEPAKHDKAAKSAVEPAEEPEKNSSPAEASATSGAARCAAAGRSESVAYEAVKFQGIAVDKSSKHELITAWGQPLESSNTPEGDVLVYRKVALQSD